MKSLNLAWLAGVCLLVGLIVSAQTSDDEAREFLEQLSSDYSVECNLQMVSRWNYITNVTDENAEEMIAANVRYGTFRKQAWQNVTAFDDSQVQDASLKRQFDKLKVVGESALDNADFQTLQETIARMETLYSSATVCRFGADSNPCSEDDVLELEGEPGQTSIESEMEDLVAPGSANSEALKYYWEQWRNATGARMRDDYVTYLGLIKKAAVQNNLQDAKVMWLRPYEVEGLPEFDVTVEELWEQLKPFYKQLHAYVRRQLANRFTESVVDLTGPIPAHLLGNMWAQDWSNLNLTVYDDVPSFDVTDAMIEQGYNATYMFQLSDQFFGDLGLLKMTETFWEKSMLEKPDDGRTVLCHASAEDFCLGNGSDDFRIKQCTGVNMGDFVTVHHEMGHIEYFMQYNEQPHVFRDGANPGFHEALGDTLALAVATPKHMAKLGLLEDITDEELLAKSDLNYLLRMALEKVVFLPYAVTLDSWRWSLFQDETSVGEMNAKYWQLRKDNQGLKPPSDRPDDLYFDPGAKYHIPGNVPYIRYFASFILQFQFYESLCKIAGEYDPNSPDSQPLHRCDFDGNADAGQKLGEALRLGFSKPWTEALEILTDSPNMSASSLLKYFDPIHVYFIQQNLLQGNCIGWEQSECEDKDSAATAYLEYYNERLQRLWNVVSEKAWNYQTNITEENGAEAIAAELAYSSWARNEWQNAINLYVNSDMYNELKNETLRRQFELLRVLGEAALPDDRLGELKRIQSQMESVYSSGKVCPFDKQECDLETEGMPLESSGGNDIEGVMGNSTDFEELKYYWKAWRDASGKVVRDDFKVYVNLSNEAAKANGLSDMGELWRQAYEVDDLPERIETIWQELFPFYERLHAYVRHKLAGVYNTDEEEVIPLTGPIPANVLGNMWSQSWEQILEIVKPTDAEALDVSEEIEAQYDNVELIFKTSDDFFVDIGLASVNGTFFYERSEFVKPDDREFTCHASAWDFYNPPDFRIKMCTSKNMGDFITVHHEMGHIQYYLQYQDQPILFREGANPGFHEAVGDLMSLSVSTPSHLEGLGLYVPPENMTEEEGKDRDLNFLMDVALQKIAFLPFGYVMDKFRWDLFSGATDVDTMNSAWWDLRNDIQGVASPVDRTEEDFDPGCKYHTIANVPYIRYFVAHILQFSFHKAMCIKTGYYNESNPDANPLYLCDISNNTNPEVGETLSSALRKGYSQHWTKTLEELTGSSEMSAEAILEYFKPLDDFLNSYIAAENVPVGWPKVRDGGTINTATTEDPDGGEQDDDEDDDETIPIVIGVSIGAIALVILVVYFILKRKRDKIDNFGAPP